MNERNYNLTDVVTLPRMDITMSVALAESLNAAASAEEQNGPLAPSIADARSEMNASCGQAKQAIAASSLKPGLSLGSIDAHTDLVFKAHRLILQGWALLSEHLPQGKEAQKLLAQLYGDGLKATQMMGKKQWVTLQSRVEAVKAAGLDQALNQLGSGPVWTLFLNAQDQYGKLIGATEAQEEAPEIAASRNALQDAIRYYILQVSASVHPKKPETLKRADALRKPLTEWKSPKTGESNKEPPVPPAPPATP